jgi:8-oxo-dGTP diphosphatase
LEENFDNILERKTGMKWVYMEQLYTFWDPKRDKRGHTLSVAYFAIIPSSTILAQADLTRIAIIRYSDLNERNTGFREEKIWGDHLDIIQFAKQRLVWKFEYTNVAKWILPPSFRLSQLQEVYEIILWEKLDKRNFQKRLFKLKVLEETGELDRTTNRPAKLYKFADNEIKIYQML